MMGKQAVTDFFVVLIVPILVLGGYYFWWKTDDVSPISATSSSVNRGDQEPGAKTRLALETLNSITLSDALFKDPAFLTLKTYRVDIPSVPVSRAYPFTAPQVIIDRLRSSSVSQAAAVVVPPSVSLSAKIDALKTAGQ